jgi:L-lactate dehydrogenase (cytochrome)
VPEAVKQIGKDAEVHVDTGIMHGADIIASIAKGAKFTLVGRAYLYGLMSGGREGVDKMISILQSDMVRTMKLLGVRSLEELEPGHVKILERLTPKQ